MSVSAGLSGTFPGLPPKVIRRGPPEIVASEPESAADTIKLDKPGRRISTGLCNVLANILLAAADPSFKYVVECHSPELPPMRIPGGDASRPESAARLGQASLRIRGTVKEWPKLCNQTK